MVGEIGGASLGLVGRLDAKLDKGKVLGLTDGLVHGEADTLKKGKLFCV